MKYRKKPVVIEAYQTDKELDIETLEGTMHASVGDYIITGVRGEKYPCKPDIFEQTYEPADAPTASPWHKIEEPPEENGAYVGWWNCKGTSYWFRCVFYDGRWLFEPGTRKPDYWMPIEPPKEDA